MNLLLASWRYIILLFSFSINGCPLLPVGCMDLISRGYATAEPATVLLMGSKLTVYCHTFECDNGFKRYLDLNKQTVNLSKRVNCTTTAFYLPRVWKPLSKVVCKMKSSQLPALEIIGGLDLRLGLPPDKPANINCGTTRSSDLVNCSLDRGRETYISTFYNVSLHRQNESVLDLILDGEEISVPRAILEENTKYTLTVFAYNHFGASRSDPFIFSLADIGIPETPRVVKVEFMHDSTSAVLHWKTFESSERLRLWIRLRGNNTWEQRAGAELSEGLIRVENLKPETEYEFQIRTCSYAAGQTTSFKASQRYLCSKWSPSVRRRSPRKGPSLHLHVWRRLGDQPKHGLRNVTVFWKPLPVEDYSGELLRYSIVLDDGREETCPAASSQCSVQAPVAVLGLNVSAVTSSGASPPAFVDLRHAGASESFSVKKDPLFAGADGSAARVSWPTTVQKGLLYFVVEWESMPAAKLQWKKVLGDINDTTITGLTAGVRYNVSLYAVTTRGVSAPTSTLIYSREQRPLSAPVLHVLTHKARQIQVRWDELPLDQRRGFISKYTVYLQALDSSSTELNVTVSGSGQRQMWLDCPEGTLSLQLTASNSAGEGPLGKRTLSEPPAPAVGLVIVIVFIITISIAIVANLMCWSCVRKRIKQKCIAWGPEWLVDNLPKPGHSNAIRLLEDDRSEPLFSFTDSDPTLSPILVVSQEEREERDEAYPSIHVEELPDGALQAKSLTRTILVEHTGYKPQIAALVPLDGEITDEREEQREDPENAEEDRLLIGFEGFLGGFLSNMDCSNSSHWATLGSTGDLLWPKTVETSVWKGVCLQEITRTQEDTENIVSSLDLQQDQREDLDSDDTRSSPFSACTFLNGGYFPQVASLDVDT